jgi:DNA polymerase III epsilon subunit-like protein
MHATLDTETTGLLENRDGSKNLETRAVEVAVAIHDDEGALVRTFSSLIHPDVITEDGFRVAEEISGILRHEILDAPRPEEVWPQLRTFLDDFSIPVRTWNLPFDQEMTYRTFRTCIEGDQDPIRWNGCIMREFTERFKSYAGRRYNGDVRWFNLGKAAALATRLGCPVEWTGDAHRALADALMSGALDAAMRLGQLVPGEMPQTGKVNLNRNRMPKTGVLKLGGDP